VERAKGSGLSKADMFTEFWSHRGLLCRSSSAWWNVPGPEQPALNRTWQAFKPDYPSTTMPVAAYQEAHKPQRFRHGAFTAAPALPFYEGVSCLLALTSFPDLQPNCVVSSAPIVRVGMSWWAGWPFSQEKKGLLTSKESCLECCRLA